MAPAWPWPSSKNPRTRQSTRSAAPAGAKTIASIFLDSAESSSFTTSSAQQDCCSDTLSTASEKSATGGDTAADAVVRGLRSSDRLIFDPPGASATSSILEEKASSGAEEAFVGSVAVAFESADPYEDFRTSMVEMVAAHGVVADWGWMEEMLGWYLRANDLDMHCAIVAAFIDVVVAIADPAGDAGSASGRSSSRTFPAVELEVAVKSKADVLAA
jgi:uncharacterized protein (TIGR01568 family)